MNPLQWAQGGQPAMVRSVKMANPHGNVVSGQMVGKVVNKHRVDNSVRIKIRLVVTM